MINNFVGISVSLKLFLHMSVYNAQSNISYVAKILFNHECPATEAVT